MSSCPLKSKNYLFLICPTDYMENVLNSSYRGKAFFYTALGADFNWDYNTQLDLTEFIENQNIKQIVFVVKSTNLFYQRTDITKYASKFRINETLLGIEESLPECFLNQSHPMLKTMLLASRHMQQQHNQILETSILGNFLKYHKISIKSFVLNPDTALFFRPKTIEKKVLLYGKLSPN